MEDMETSFTLFDQNLSTVHESDEMSSPLLSIIRRRSRIALFRIDEPRDVDSGFFMDDAPLSMDDSKPFPETRHEVETNSSSGSREAGKSKRSAFTSSRSRMSAVKKRSRICFEEIGEAYTTAAQEMQGSGTRHARRNLFDEHENDDDIALSASERPQRGCSTIDAASHHRRTTAAAAAAVGSLVPWKKHASLPAEERMDGSQSMARFPKCRSDAELFITSALSRSSDDQQLIGDYSRPCRLPTISGKHQDLKTISHETMASVVGGGYSASVADYIIIDCRYPYEYEAGHITGARNIYSKDEIVSQFLSPGSSLQSIQKSPILIFHCEFSSERGPKLLRYLRNRDRCIHRENYPALYYPEMYLLEGGYKEFCQWHLDLCQPNGYKPMLDKDHCDELSYYRSKSRLYSSRQSQAATDNERMEKHKFTSLRC